MADTVPGSAARAQRWQMRSYEPADEAAVLGLVNADRLPGRPPATAGMPGKPPRTGAASWSR